MILTDDVSSAGGFTLDRCAEEESDLIFPHLCRAGEQLRQDDSLCQTEPAEVVQASDQDVSLWRHSLPVRHVMSCFRAYVYFISCDDKIRDQSFSSSPLI